MNFSIALANIRCGLKVARQGWNGKGMWIRLHIAEKPNRLPYIEMKTVSDEYVPWLASQTDILADDWVVVNNPDI